MVFTDTRGKQGYSGAHCLWQPLVVDAKLARHRLVESVQRCGYFVARENFGHDEDPVLFERPDLKGRQRD
jgi:hypothetical protein